MTDQTQNQGGATGGDGGATNTNAQTWYSGFENAELRGFVENKGWKGPDAAVESYRQLEKSIGVPPERLLKLPEKADDPAWRDVRARVGFAVPEKAEDYGLPVPEGMDPNYAARAQAKALELGVPKEMAVKFAEWQNGEMAALIAADQQAAQQQSETELADLKREWGTQFPASSELAKRAAQEFAGLGKLDAESLNAMEGAMGTANYLRMWAAIGSKMGEAKFVDAGDAGTKGGLMSPDAARARIAQLTADREWGKRKLAGGAAENQEWDLLHRIAYPADK